MRFGKLIWRQLCQEDRVKAAPTIAGAAFVLAGLVMVSVVVAHDGGVRLICAGWVPQDDDSDVNVTAVYRRASRTIFANRVVAHRFLAGWFTHRTDA